MDDLEAARFEQVGEAGEGIVAEVLVIDGVVLDRVQERHQVVGFRDEHAVVGDQRQDAVDYVVDVLDVGEAVGGGD